MTQQQRSRDFNCVQVYIPPLDTVELLKDVMGHCEEHAVKALVDDTYLGYISQAELDSALLALQPSANQFRIEATSKPGVSCSSSSAGIYKQLVAECLACRKPGIVEAALASLEAADALLLLSDADVLRECLGVGEVGCR